MLQINTNYDAHVIDKSGNCYFIYGINRLIMMEQLIMEEEEGKEKKERHEKSNVAFLIPYGASHDDGKNKKQFHTHASNSH